MNDVVRDFYTSLAGVSFLWFLLLFFVEFHTRATSRLLKKGLKWVCRISSPMLLASTVPVVHGAVDATLEGVLVAAVNVGFFLWPLIVVVETAGIVYTVYVWGGLS